VVLELGHQCELSTILWDSFLFLQLLKSNRYFILACYLAPVVVGKHYFGILVHFTTTISILSLELVLNFIALCSFEWIKAMTFKWFWLGYLSLWGQVFASPTICALVPFVDALCFYCLKVALHMCIATCINWIINAKHRYQYKQNITKEDKYHPNSNSSIVFISISICKFATK
jgi:hypothetical protein